MENTEFTSKQQQKIRDSYCSPDYPLPHGEKYVVSLLAAMIASGKFEISDYPRLVDEAFKLNALLVVRFDEEVARVPDAVIINSDGDRIPF